MTPPPKAPRPPRRLDSLREIGAGLDLLRGVADSTRRMVLPFGGATLADLGQGRRVAVLPGFGADDLSTSVLRRHLAHRGFRAEGWHLGRNSGDVVGAVIRFTERLSFRVAAAGRPYALVGWSLGGYIAREVARNRPDLVERVVTLGTPVRGGPKYTVFAPVYRARGLDLDRIESRIAARETVPLTVPVTALYSRRDGIVGWRACLSPDEPMVRHEEIATSHCGMGFAPEVLARVAAILAEA
ncbi:alpha/beta hydrolase [Zavarzinia compransoris]|uniref:alpha/beta fold hydrolase n=1 Tax=Zavarzinia marina TaxID=2911065 RepID=UPI001F24FA47|nr:alpha/beta hydrolase [Zavarzinia marina]MCF4166513.1 alpha/beta hydrolase [Zavarzinia marina]